MVWDLSAEGLSLVLTLTLLVFYIRGRAYPSLKNRLFFMCLLVSLVSIIVSLLSTISVYQFRALSLNLVWLINTLYFLTTPLMAPTYFAYTVAHLNEHKPWDKRQWFLTFMPYALYIFLVLLINPLTGMVFTVDAEHGYEAGLWHLASYVILAVYILLWSYFMIRFRRQLDRSVWLVLLFFPLISIVLISIQLLSRVYVLSGAAAACSLLVLFLNSQNQRITHDSRTGLPNRYAFLLNLDEYLKTRGTIRFLMITVLDVQTIGLRHGESIAENLLGQIAATIRAVTSPAIVHRYGGDRFIAVLNGSQAEDHARISQELLSQIGEARAIGQQTFVMRAAIGEIAYPTVAKDSQSIINGLELAVAEAESETSLRIVSASSGLLADYQRRTAVKQALETALRDHRFELFVQPVWSINLRRYNRFEALVRLPDSDMGFLMPAEFIEIAEETGLIVPLTYEVVAMVCSFTRSLDENPNLIDFVSLNLPRSGCLNESFFHELARIIDGYGLPRSRFRFEIKEQAFLHNPNLATDQIPATQQAGFQFILDNFGSGYTVPLADLGKLFATVKLDRSIMSTAMKDLSGRMFVGKLVRSLQALGPTIVVVGVETIEQHLWTLEIHCDGIQGYYYTEPMSTEDAIPWLIRESAGRTSFDSPKSASPPEFAVNV